MRIFKNRKKDVRFYVLIIIGLFAIISLITVLKWGDSNLLGSLQEFDNDDVKYVRSAWTLNEKGIVTYENTEDPTVYIMPGLTYVLAIITKIFGKVQGLVAFRVFQVIVQSFSLYLIFLIAKKAFNEKVAIIACIIDALYIVEIYVTSLILMETIFKFLFLLLIYLSMKAIKEKKMKYYIIAGIVWAVDCLFRPTVAVYPLVIIILWIKEKYDIKDMIKYTLTVFLVFCTVMGPWWIRNYVNFDRFILFTKSSGNPFLQGTFPNYDESMGLGVPHESSEDFLEDDEKEIKMGMERLKKYGKEEPGKYIWWYTIGKTVVFWKDAFYWRGGQAAKIIDIEHMTMLITGILGILVYFIRKDKNMEKSTIFLSMLIINLAYLPYCPFSRYSYPLMCLMAIFSGYIIYIIGSYGYNKIMEVKRIEVKNNLL